MSGERRERGTPEPIRDPAFAVAAAKCVVARDLGSAALGGITPRFFHPKECAFCEFDQEFLRDAVAEFTQWAGLVESSTFDPAMPELYRVEPAVERFMQMPFEDQAWLVQKAQGYR